MNFDFLSGFQPKILHMHMVERPFWEEFGYVFRRDNTIAHLLIVVCDGQGELELNGSSYALRSGAFVYIAPGSRLQLVTQPEPEQTLRFYSLLFFHGPWRWEEAQPVWDQAYKVSHPMPLPEVTAFGEKSVLLDICQRMAELWARRAIGFEYRARSEFFHLLEAYLAMMHGASRQLERHADIVEEAAAYIRDHLREPLDRVTLAKRVCLSPDYFGALFKKHIGCSVVEYVTRQRMNRAKELLCGTRLPVYRIAEEVGYADVYYFTRQFSKEIGLSPRQFRKV
ncbi:MAG: transcriptional regulator [Paenibacillus sp.]|jgi:AraC-like DNA-binding protein|nr:transcriptional regulator [Paenibacillus sp.]